MKKITALVGIALCLLPIASVAAKPATHKAPAKKAVAAPMYECQVCHMKVSAAVAKKDHYKDTMDGGALIPVKPAPAKGSMGAMKM